jgi:hypothetical protein
MIEYRTRIFFMPTPESTPEIPWAILGISRRQFVTARPWNKVGMTKEKYAEMLNVIPHEAIRLGLRLFGSRPGRQGVLEHTDSTGKML